jgi:acyl carrier protein
MTHDALREEVRGVIAGALHLPPAQLPADATADSVEAWDSLGHLAVLHAVMEHFQIDLDHAQAVTLTTEALLTARVRALHSKK